MKYTSNLDRTDLGFDRYFEKCLKEGTRSSRRKVHSIYLKEILLKSFTKWLRLSSKTTKTRINWRNICLWNCSNFTRVIRLWLQHIKTYQQVSHPPAPSWTQVSVRRYETEKTDQRLVRHTLNLINNRYKNILVCTIDTDVLVLLISYMGQVELGHIVIHTS